MRIVVLYNEPSEDAAVADHDVAAQRDAVCSALDRLGHEAVPVGCTLNLARLQGQLRETRPAMVFNLVESLGGTDRLMHLATWLLDAMQIPYTGAATEAILPANNKVRAKQLLHSAGLPTPAWWTVDAAERGGTRDAARRQCSPGGAACQQFPLSSGRVIIKPVFEHASLGMEDGAVASCGDVVELERLIRRRENAARRPHFAEAFVDGREFNLSLLADGAGPPQVLPPAEIDFSDFPPGKPRIVGHRAKWEPASFEYRGTPRRFEFSASDQPLLDALRGYALRCWELFHLRGYARVDFRVDADGRPWILEVNANPCLTPDAGFAAAAQRAGICYDHAIQRILEDSRKP